MRGGKLSKKLIPIGEPMTKSNKSISTFICLTINEAKLDIPILIYKSLDGMYNGSISMNSRNPCYAS